MKITKDGDHYLVAADNFINLQESKDYFFIPAKEYEAFRARAIQADREALKEKLGDMKIHNPLIAYFGKPSYREVREEAIDQMLTLLERQNLKTDMKTNKPIVKPNAEKTLREKISYMISAHNREKLHIDRKESVEDQILEAVAQEINEIIGEDEPDLYPEHDGRCECDYCLLRRSYETIRNNQRARAKERLK